jgi:hypothetical protein
MMSRKYITTCRLRYLSWKGVALTLSCVCLFAAGSYIWKWWGPTPYAVAYKFARAWEQGNTEKMYALLDNVPEYVIKADDRRRPPREGFEWLMQNYIFRIAPPGTRWHFEVSDPKHILFRFTTPQHHWMGVPVRRSLDGKWRVSGLTALRTLYQDHVADHKLPAPDQTQIAKQKFRILWASAWTKFTSPYRF